MVEVSSAEDHGQTVYNIGFWYGFGLTAAGRIAAMAAHQPEYLLYCSWIISVCIITGHFAWIY